MVRELFARVGEIALLGCESWMITKTRYEEIEVWQNHRLRDFLRLRRRRNQDYEEWMRESSPILRRIMIDNQIDSLGVRWLRRVQSFPQRAWSQPLVGGTRLLWTVLGWRTRAAWKAAQAMLHSVDRGNSLSWRHAVGGIEETWERPVVQVHGEDWRDSLIV